MQSNQNFRKKVLPPFVNKVVGYNMHNFSPASDFGTNPPSSEIPSMPFHGFEFQSSMACPKNFIIFDQTDNRSQIMYHPAIANKLSYPPLNMGNTYNEINTERNVTYNEEGESSLPFKENSNDIDALLSLEDEEEEEEEYSDDEVSTARTNGHYGNYGNSSADSYSVFGSKPRKNRILPASIQKSYNGGNSASSERKRMKLKKMVHVLKGIVPGGNQMDTAGVLDEAVKYLKSLKDEAENMGLGDLKNYP